MMEARNRATGQGPMAGVSTDKEVSRVATEATTADANSTKAVEKGSKKIERKSQWH